MEWLLYMVVSALILEGLTLFVKEHSFHNEVLDTLVTDFENDSPIEFVVHIIVYVIVVACMPLILFEL